MNLFLNFLIFLNKYKLEIKFKLQIVVVVRNPNGELIIKRKKQQINKLTQKELSVVLHESV